MEINESHELSRGLSEDSANKAFKYFPASICFRKSTLRSVEKQVSVANSIRQQNGMAEIHDLIAAKGKKAAIEAGWPPELVHAAGIYLADEDTGLGFAYSGWAQVSLPVRRPADDAIWSVTSERIKLLIEPGRRPRGDDYELVGVPWGCHARLILLWL